ncbi:UV DNA damage repair endonuclease UvsE [Shimazuella kribbensis]|uniref:UV DNA damage repair endonuclease UvsE n=1 Tax=Shimazuella kribbensis TaxID=139808 RepID=UPI0004909DA5|nr:UV DNA damage repair endonuclease UvsE [Shimazuella kribbensis]
MIIRFGFVAMSTHVYNSSPSKTMTVKAFQSIPDKRLALRRVLRIAKENIAHTKRILYHAAHNGILFYRFSSRLIPLLGHEVLGDKDFIRALKEDFADIGKVVLDNKMRVGFHPDHFTVLNTPRKDVLRSSVKDLIRHVRMLQSMGLNQAYKCNIHIGGVYNDKKAAGERFVERFLRLDPRIQAYICLENDDKTFTAQETLDIAKSVGVPMVFDLHHHRCNNNGEAIEDLFPIIVESWTKEVFPPKIHVSSPKSESDIRSHADYVALDDIVPFLHVAKQYTKQLDIMIEAKQKDDALFRLVEDLAALPEVKKMDGGILEIT